MTFSLVACDSDTGEWGVAVASKFLAVGAVVPFARSRNRSNCDPSVCQSYVRPRGLELLRGGASAQEVVDSLVSSDDAAATRQLGVVDSQGRAAAFTGDECFDWAGNSVGTGFTCQGNILAGPDVVANMQSAFEGAGGELARRLLAALKAGDEAGGDRRGRQSASVLVVQKDAGYGGETDVAVDLRVDDHSHPVEELHRLMDLHRLYFPRPEDLDFLTFDDDLASEVRSLLQKAGYEAEGSGFDSSLRDALFAYVGTENLEERWSEEAQIERGILEHLRAELGSRSCPFGPEPSLLRRSIFRKSP